MAMPRVAWRVCHSVYPHHDSEKVDGLAYIEYQIIDRSAKSECMRMFGPRGDV